MTLHLPLQQHVYLFIVLLSTSSCGRYDYEVLDDVHPSVTAAGSADAVGTDSSETLGSSAGGAEGGTSAGAKDSASDTVSVGSSNSTDTTQATATSDTTGSTGSGSPLSGTGGASSTDSATNAGSSTASSTTGNSGSTSTDSATSSSTASSSTGSGGSTTSDSTSSASPTAGSQSCANTGTPTYLESFASDVAGFQVAGSGSQTLTHTSAWGNPELGALDYTNGGGGKGQAINRNAPGDLSGHFVSAYVYVEAPSAVNIEVFVQTGGNNAWGSSGVVAVPPGQWTCLVLDIDNPLGATASFDPTDVRTFGVQVQGLNSGNHAYIDQVAY